MFALLAAPPAGVDLLVILTIRADGYDPLAAALAGAADTAERAGAARRTALHETPLTLLPLATTAYRDVIRRPAQVALKTERDVFEPALVDYLVDTSTGADALPLLAMTLEQLYAEYVPRQQITYADYEALYAAHSDADGGVPLDASFAEQKKILKRCPGLFYLCAGGAEARRFNRLLIDAGLIQGF